VRELLLPVAEGVDTKRWVLERRVKLLEDQLVAWWEEPNPPLAREGLVRQLEHEVCQLYELLERCESWPRPIDVARAIEELGEEGFRYYLDSFKANQVIGRAGLLADCPLALYISHGTMIHMVGVRLRVLLDHALLDDGFDEVRAALPQWAERVVRATTPPEYPGTLGEAITVQRLRRLLHGRGIGDASSAKST
jgi:hypothetical protein